jgi:Homeodomain-like domain
MKPQGIVDLSFTLTAAGLRDSDNAKICGVALATIRRWRRRYQRQGLPRGQAHMSVPCPRCDKGTLNGEAYALLLGWYLGDGHIAHQHDGVYSLAIANDLRYPGLNTEIAAAMTGVKTGGRVHTRRQPGSLETKLTWKHWPCLFPQHGPGMKHTRPIILEPWQQEIVEQHPGRFLRGLFHSDGCRITNWTERLVDGRRKRYEYPRYFFTNASTDILRLCTWGLDLLGIAWRQTNPRHISVARRAAVEVLDLHVGPKY